MNFLSIFNPFTDVSDIIKEMLDDYSTQEQYDMWLEDVHTYNIHAADNCFWSGHNRMYTDYFGNDRHVNDTSVFYDGFTPDILNGEVVEEYVPVYKRLQE